MREGIEREMRPVLRGRSRLEPWQGKVATRVPPAPNPVVCQVAVKGGGLNGRREPSGCWVDLRGGAEDSQVSQAALVREEQVKRGEAGLDGQDVDRRAHKAISCPALGLVPKHGEFPNHVGGGREHVRTIAEDGEK